MIQMPNNILAVCVCVAFPKKKPSYLIGWFGELGLCSPQ